MNVTAARWWWLVVLAAPVAGYTWLCEADRRVSSLDDVTTSEAPEFPRRIESWAGRDVPVSDRTIELLGTDEILNREYRDRSGARVHLCVVRSRGERGRVHPPEVCFRGWGYEVEETSRVIVEAEGDSFEANLLRLHKPDRRIIALYWYRHGDRRTASFLGQQLRSTWLSRVAGASDDGALVRLTAAVDPGSSADDERRIVDMLRRFAALYASRADAPVDVEINRHAASR